MPSIPFPSFFPISVPCILSFFSQKALIPLWAGNAWDVCVTAKCHGNGGRQGRQGRQAGCSSSAPAPPVATHIRSIGGKTRGLQQEILQMNSSSHPNPRLQQRCRPFQPGKEREFPVLPEATANARSGTRPRSQAGSTESGAVLQSQNKQQAEPTQLGAAMAAAPGLPAAEEPGREEQEAPGHAPQGRHKDLGRDRDTFLCPSEPHASPPKGHTFVLLQLPRWGSASLIQRHW